MTLPMDFAGMDIDQILHSLEQIDDQLTNLLSLYEELGDLSQNLEKFENQKENTHSMTEFDEKS
ncbi:hypothetical protein M153_3180002688 [Pseudoloma neurophilia]|uniref:Uncharacterized protein n=1 Tax=Pseudoloma neurophilia TaxID=146866 RepID=A0A0R0M3T7_9MICR|nr:hypothetical protein M153_3180002688 [Pseudoloma neurophilia]